MSIHDHILLRYLDEPLKFLIFDVDDVILGGIGFYILLVSEGSIGGFLIGASLVIAWRRFKKFFRGSSLQAVLYWYLPYFQARTRAFPPSYKREFV